MRSHYIHAGRTPNARSASNLRRPHRAVLRDVRRIGARARAASAPRSNPRCLARSVSRYGRARSGRAPPVGCSRPTAPAGPPEGAPGARPWRHRPATPRSRAPDRSRAGTASSIIEVAEDGRDLDGGDVDVVEPGRLECPPERLRAHRSGSGRPRRPVSPPDRARSPRPRIAGGVPSRRRSPRRRPATVAPDVATRSVSRNASAGSGMKLRTRPETTTSAERTGLERKRRRVADGEPSSGIARRARAPPRRTRPTDRCPMTDAGSARTRIASVSAPVPQPTSTQRAPRRDRQPIDEPGGHGPAPTADVGLVRVPVAPAVARHVSPAPPRGGGARGRARSRGRGRRAGPASASRPAGRAARRRRRTARRRG